MDVKNSNLKYEFKRVPRLARDFTAFQPLDDTLAVPLFPPLGALPASPLLEAMAGAEEALQSDAKHPLYLLNWQIHYTT